MIKSEIKEKKKKKSGSTFADSMDTDRGLVESIRAMSGEREPAPAGGSRFTYVVTEADGKTTVKQVLRRRLGFSHRLISKLKQNGTVTRNGKIVRMFADVIPGDVVGAVLPEERCHFEPMNIPIEAVYEDDDMLVINKQPWVVVHPTHSHLTDTIANGLMQRMIDTGESYKIRFVNRLDRDTSGLLIIAKNSHCQDVLSQDMKSDLVEKRYIAVVHGIVAEDEGVIDLPVGKRSPEDVKRCVMEDGYPSVTHYKVTGRFAEKRSGQDGDCSACGNAAAGVPAAAFGGGFSLLELRLETGRTHQIRVHMSHIGHPLVGDPQYGREEPELLDRQALHAAKLRLRQPVSGEMIDIEAGLPDDITGLIEKLKKNCVYTEVR